MQDLPLGIACTVWLHLVAALPSNQNQNQWLSRAVFGLVMYTLQAISTITRVPQLVTSASGWGVP